MIRLRGARHHHLHGLDLDLLLGSWTAIVGPSGSGKTTLVHDTLVAEGRRRWLAQLSGPARTLLGKAGRPALDRLDGLPLPVSLRSTSRGSARSTVGTRSGLHDLLRLVFAREATVAPPQPLTRSHFSFNHPVGACEACQGHGIEDLVDLQRLVADPTRSIRDGALVPTLPSGYTMYSQVTLDVMDQLCQAHGFTVDTPWQALDDVQKHMVFYGTDRLVVPFGKHDLASRMKWSGITARPRQEGHYKGLVPVIEETLKRNRNANILRFVRSAPCSACGGTRLGPLGRTAQIADTHLPQLLARPIRTLPDALGPVLETPTGGAFDEAMTARLEQLMALDLGHLSLDRTLPTLSGGEAQRLALAALLGTELSGLLFALDEPTLGLHPEAQPGLLRALEAVRQRGNTLVTVEHDPDFVRHADRVVVLGPGSGANGGRVVSDGPPGLDPLGPPPVPRAPRPDRGLLWLRGAKRRTLQQVDLPVHLGTFTVLMGRSGAGKSTLMMDCLLPALEGRADETTGHLNGPAPSVVEALDASPLGRTPRSTPATWTGWFDTVRKRFAATDEAKGLGLRAGAFAYNGKRGRCPDCEGLGVERIRLHLLEDLLRPCPTCLGRRYGPEPLQVRWRDLDIADVLELSVDEATERFADDDGLSPLLLAMQDLGLGHLPLGQPSPTLSRGEAQRVRLATTLARAGQRGRRGRDGPGPILLLDEPDRGLHPDDLARLVAALDRLVEAGHTVVAISHHRHLWAAADHRIQLVDGQLVVEPELPKGRLPTSGAAPPSTVPDAIHLRGVRTHHLHDLDVRIPRRALVGIVGVSGSGKSSLAVGTLAAEAERRASEMLPFAVRRHLRRLPRPELEQASGLTPTLLLRQTGPTSAAAGRSTVGTALDIDPLLRLLASRAGTVDGVPTELTAGHFSPLRPEGACPDCSGRGQVDVVDPERLVTHGQRSLRDGAMQGTKTGKYLGEPDGQHLATLQAALVHVGLPGPWLDTPWSDLPDDVVMVALHGAGDVEFDVVWSYQRGKRTGEHHFRGPWPGLAALASEEARLRAGRKDAEAWRACLVPNPCPSCEGVGLSASARGVTIGGRSLPALRETCVDALLPLLDGLRDERTAAVVEAMRPELAPRLADAAALGLGPLRLDTPTGTLSGADRQRLRLARVLSCGLSALTLVLDEPASGLPPSALPALVTRLRAAVDDGNTVVVVTHRPALMRAMDHLIELGPGRGADGGQILAEGPVAAFGPLDTPTAKLLAAPPSAAELPVWRPGSPLPPSGLVWVEHLADVAFASRFHDASGLDRRHTVLDVLDGLRPLQRLFHGLSDDLPARAYSFRSPTGRCPTCSGSGIEAVALDGLADLELPCPACEGRRYRPEVLAVHWPGTGDHVAGFLARAVDELLPALEEDGSAPARSLARAGQRLQTLGLGALALGRALGSLSGGEVQRVTLAAFDPGAPPTQVRLEQPDRGLHGADLPAVARHLEALAAAGHQVVVAGARPGLRLSARPAWTR